MTNKETKQTPDLVFYEENNKRYIEYTENCKDLARIYDLDSNPIPVYMRVFYGYFDKKSFKSKEILLSGYTYKNDNQHVIIEYLNLDGYLEKRIYDNVPLIFHRKILE